MPHTLTPPPESRWSWMWHDYDGNFANALLDSQRNVILGVSSRIHGVHADSPRGDGPVLIDARIAVKPEYAGIIASALEMLKLLKELEWSGGANGRG